MGRTRSLCDTLVLMCHRAFAMIVREAEDLLRDSFIKAIDEERRSERRSMTDCMLAHEWPGMQCREKRYLRASDPEDCGPAETMACGAAAEKCCWLHAGDWLLI